MDEEENGGLVEEMMAAAGEIASTGEFRNPYRKQLVNLSRRIKLLVPMLEEIKERNDPISISISISDEEDAVGNLAPLLAPLRSAKELLRFGNQGSKICLVLERDKILKMFQEITTQLEQALSEISYEKLDLSDEVREQVELVHAQFKRAKERVDTPDEELYSDISSIYNVTDANAADPAILRRLAEQLHLMTIHDLKQESLALQELVVSSGGVDPGLNIEKMSMLLRKIKDFVQTQNPEMGAPADTRVLPSVDEPRVPAVPDDFRCPISLQLMKDPVIVSTGQTYERGCIEKWTKYGHDTCPKTQQKLSSTEVTPNYVLRSLISQWCEANGMDPPERPLWPSEPPSTCHAAEHAKVVDLVRKLSSLDLEDQQSAAGELRLLAKRSAENRVCIAAAAAIPQLVSLLSKSDTRIQEHAVTALLNLSICEENKGRIVSCWAVPGIVQVLKKGSMEARENAAATLFSLSVVDGNKVTIGASGAIPALASLLIEGSQRGKKDAATALFNLCIYQGNKGKAVRAGVIPTLMRLLTEPGGGMVDEALAILAILSSNSDGKAAIGAAEAVPVLVEIIGNGSPRNRENAAAVLLHLCSGELQQQRLAEAQGLRVVSLLHDLAINGTDRGKRKATHLLERMNRFLEQQKQAEDATQA